MKGAYCQLPELIQQRFSGRQLDLRRRNRARSLLSGANKSNFRGRGIDFEEVRSYQPGDDIRGIDWRVTARTGEPHTKIFREERERPLLIVTDLRNAMFFGSRRCFKSVLACHVAALLGWAGLNQGDRVGGLVFSDAGHREVRPKRHRRTLLSLLNQLTQRNLLLPTAETAASEQSFSNALLELRRIARPGSSIFIISDFRGASDGRAEDSLYQLSRHTEINALHCSDPLEAELPDSGVYRVTDGSTDADLFTGRGQLRQRFHQDYLQRLERLRSDYGGLGIPVIDLSPRREPLEQLLPLYSARQLPGAVR
ncbi:MAG: DUF58 domain-containing protein [Halieaceae bacterium]|nr:DUF58 domain-containing protein [Halieaceae bacterium]